MFTTRGQSKNVNMDTYWESEYVDVTTTHTRFTRQFIRQLEDYNLPLVFNPYRDRCPECDKADAPVIRKRNLKRWLEFNLERSCEYLWVGRDLGYLGGRRTGIPFVDEGILADDNLFFQRIRVCRATKDKPKYERSAQTIWQAIRNVNSPVMLWNVFPFHPHLHNNPLSNRCHSIGERNVGISFLESLLGHIQPSSVIAVGRDAERVLTGLGVSPKYVRHPSHGGKNEFLKGIRRHT